MPHSLTSAGLPLALAAVLLAVPSGLSAPTKNTEEVAKSAQVEPQRSEFTVPESVSEGRDPFFPESTHFIKTVDVAPNAGPVVLTLKGISGTADRPLALINDRTLTVGETAHVRTPQGRVEIKLLAITGLKVIIQIGSETRELSIRGDSLAGAADR